MTTGEIVLAAFISLLSAGLGTLFWARLNRLEQHVLTLAGKDELASLGTEVRMDLAESRRELRADLESFKTEVRAELAEFRREIADLRRELREDLAALRSDLTQVALAVGVSRPESQAGGRPTRENR